MWLQQWCQEMRKYTSVSGRDSWLSATQSANTSCGCQETRKQKAVSSRVSVSSATSIVYENPGTWEACFLAPWARHSLGTSIGQRTMSWSGLFISSVSLLARGPLAPPLSSFMVSHNAQKMLFIHASSWANSALHQPQWTCHRSKKTVCQHQPSASGVLRAAQPAHL